MWDPTLRVTGEVERRIMWHWNPTYPIHEGIKSDTEGVVIYPGCLPLLMFHQEHTHTDKHMCVWKHLTIPIDWNCWILLALDSSCTKELFSEISWHWCLSFGLAFLLAPCSEGVISPSFHFIHLCCTLVFPKPLSLWWVHSSMCPLCLDSCHLWKLLARLHFLLLPLCLIPSSPLTLGSGSNHLLHAAFWVVFPSSYQHFSLAFVVLSF